MFKILLLILLSINAYAKTVKVAIIDSGYTKPARMKEAKLCPKGHKNIITGKTSREDIADATQIRHGTNIAHIIYNIVGNEADYCLVIIKMHGTAKSSGVERSAKALRYAIASNVNIINYSGGGEEESKEETRLIKTALNRGITVVAAAGNFDKKLSKTKCSSCTAYYPAMSDPRVIVVGALQEGFRFPASNYGTIVDIWANGFEVLGGGVILSGTSQASAIVTGRIVKKYFELRRKK